MLILPGQTVRQFNARSKLAKSSKQATGLGGAWPLAEGGGAVAYDLTGENNLTTVGSPNSMPGPNGPALLFNGTSQYASKTGTFWTPGTANFAISMWVYLTGSTTTVWCPIGLIGAATSSITLDINIISPGYWGMQFYTNAGVQTVVPYVALNQLTPNNWHHIVGVRTGLTTAALYHNGISQPVTYYTTGTTVNLPAMAEAVLGANTTGGPFYWSGGLQDVRVYPRALSAAEVQSLYLDPIALVRPVRRYYGAASAIIYPKSNWAMF